MKKQKIICPDCDGEGKINEQECSECKGKGYIYAAIERQDENPILKTARKNTSKKLSKILIVERKKDEKKE